jgi:5,10-methylenetetrahydromethanopterin reductase
VVAASLATLGIIAPGRILAGVGVGDSAVYGIGLQPQRLAEFEVGLERLKALLRGDEVTMGDRTVGIAAANVPPAPLFVAASQPKMLALAGKIADGAIVMGPANLDVFRSQIDQIRRSATAARRDPRDVVVDLWVTMAVGNDGVDAVRSWASAQARWLDRWERLPPSLRRFRGELTRAAAEYDFGEHLSVGAGHAFAVSDELVAELAIAGPLDHCRDRLAEIVALGPDRVTVSLLSGGRERRLTDLMSVWEGVGPG